MLMNLTWEPIILIIALSNNGVSMTRKNAKNKKKVKYNYKIQEFVTLYGRILKIEQMRIWFKVEGQSEWIEGIESDWMQGLPLWDESIVGWRGWLPLDECIFTDGVDFGLDEDIMYLSKNYYNCILQSFPKKKKGD